VFSEGRRADRIAFRRDDFGRTLQENARGSESRYHNTDECIQLIHDAGFAAQQNTVYDVQSLSTAGRRLRGTTRLLLVSTAPWAE
jgi:hypothetical protein